MGGRRWPLPGHHRPARVECDGAASSEGGVGVDARAEPKAASSEVEGASTGVSGLVRSGSGGGFSHLHETGCAREKEVDQRATQVSCDTRRRGEDLEQGSP